MPGWKKVKGGGSMPRGEWKRATALLDVHGLHHRKESAVAYAKAVLKLHPAGRPFGLLIEPEPSNPHDPNALKIIGWGRSGNFHIGYVEAIEAAWVARRYPREPLAAEFYSLYQSVGGFLEIRYFLCVSKDATPRASDRVRHLLDMTRDELMVLCYAARADNKIGRLEADILDRYAAARASDFGVSLVDEDVADIKRWCKGLKPTTDEVEAAIHRLADEPGFSPEDLWDLIEIVMGADGKISKAEKTAAADLSRFIGEAIADGATPR